VSAQPGTKESFIPDNWTVIQETYGDMNKDSVDDVALIIEYAGDALEGERPRSLLILFKEKKNEQYTKICMAEHVILDGLAGGTMGDPFESMTIKKNVLILTFSGGSREQWTTTHRYRLKDNSYFSVIGATYKIEDMGVINTYDYNLLNGNIILTTKDSNIKANNKTINKTLKLMPINLDSFEPDALWAILMPKEYDPNIVQLPLTDAGVGDCAHIFFDDMDFGNAELYLDEASQKLWFDLTTSNQNDETVVNPTYKGKTFEITYIGKLGTKCEPQGEESYQLVIGFKLVP
ncbi:unnamed protein product, partial [Phaeothamnion confervicola]